MSLYSITEAPKMSKKKKVNRLTMPHLITQWKPGQFSRDGMSVKELNKADKKSAKSVKSAQNQNFGSDWASMSGSNTATTPKSKRWDFVTIRHKTQASPDFAVTPCSAVDPVFEMEPVELPESPNSSTHSSSWVFELEDTSRIALHSKRSAFPGPQLEFQSTAITSRSVIKVIDQTIAAIEADNRKLLSRAVAAEATVKALREHNFNLQLKVDHCEKAHHRHPRTVISQPDLRVSRHNLTTPVSAAQFSASDPLMTQLSSPTSARKSSSVKPDSTKSHSPALSYPPYSPAKNFPNKPLPLPPRRPRRPSEPSQQIPPLPAQLSPVKPLIPSQSPPQFPIVKPLFTSHSPPQFSAARLPSQFSPVRSPMTPRSRKSRAMSKQHNLSLSKPLPPLGPPGLISLNGNIKIGLGIGPQYRELEGDLADGDRGFIPGLLGDGHPQGMRGREMEEKKWI